MSAQIKYLLNIAAAFLGILLSQMAQAHDVPATNVLLDIGSRSINVELQLPVPELRSAMHLPETMTGHALLSEKYSDLENYILQHASITTTDGSAYATTTINFSTRRGINSELIIARLRFDAPQNKETRIFLFDYDAIVADIETHNVFVSVRKDFRNAIFSGNTAGDNSEGDKPAIVGLMHYQLKQLKIDGSDGSWWRGFKKIFRLGMQHIAEGNDHILFLLVLLLSAPLATRHKRWSGIVNARSCLWNVTKIVSGFTLGHSLTLALGAIGAIHFPSRPVEVAIALSIVISALHAIYPLFPNREHYVAAFFGLIHGMAFAGALTGFDYDTRALILAILGFNLGIEAMQLIIVAVALPPLLIMRALPTYGFIRVAAASLAGIVAIGWALERAVGIESPLLHNASTGLKAHALFTLGLLIVYAVAARLLKYYQQRREHFGEPRKSRIDLADPFNP